MEKCIKYIYVGQSKRVCFTFANSAYRVSLLNARGLITAFPNQLTSTSVNMNNCFNITKIDINTTNFKTIIVSSFSCDSANDTTTTP